MRILISSNPPFSRSGYGVQTALLAPRMKAAGHEVAIACEAGLLFGHIEHDGILLLPGNGADAVDKRRGAAEHARRWRADIVITLNDVWPYDAEAMSKVRWIPFYPVDSGPLPYHYAHHLRHAWDSVVYSQWGRDVAAAAGITSHHIPLMFDPADYYYDPEALTRSRAELGIDPGAFVGVVVADNCTQPSRKSWAQIFQAWRATCDHVRRDGGPSPVLLAHTTTNQSRGGENLEHLAIECGITESVQMADPYVMMIGGYDAGYLRRLYSASDVLLSPSMAEGFGVPIVEAQACGCPVLVGDWTSMPELVRAGRKIPKSAATPHLTPFVSWVYYPHPTSIAQELRAMYEDRERTRSREYRAQASDNVQEYAADRVYARYWEPYLAHVEARIEREQAEKHPPAGAPLTTQDGIVAGEIVE